MILTKEMKTWKVTKNNRTKVNRLKHQWEAGGCGENNKGKKKRTFEKRIQLVCDKKGNVNMGGEAK